MAVFFFRENRFLKSNRSIRHFEAIDFDRHFETWSIFDETSDMGVFEGAESNGGVRISSKSRFVVESSFASVGATTAPMTSIRLFVSVSEQCFNDQR